MASRWQAVSAMTGVIIMGFVVLAGGSLWGQSTTQAVDMEKAQQLMQKQRRGEALTPQEQEILDAARAARRAGRNLGKAETAAGEPRAGRGGRRAIPTEGQASTGIKPLTEMGREEKFRGEDGGLYGRGSNEPPSVHLASAMKQVAQIQSLDVEGRPSKDGKIVLLAIGMSNTTQEFSAFMKSANADRAKSPAVVLVDAAQGGHGAEEWTNAQSDETWARLDQRIKQAGVSHKQVQALWLKQAEHYPKPDAMGNAKVLKAQLVTILQRAMARCPNLKVAYVSSRSYGGYSVKHPEPESFATAFSVRWVIQDQIAGKLELNFDPAKGEVKAPIVLWGPYLWADGTTRRKSDGLVWNRADYRADGTHPTASGRAKVTAMLMNFFKTDPTAKAWYLASQQR